MKIFFATHGEAGRYLKGRGNIPDLAFFPALSHFIERSYLDYGIFLDYEDLHFIITRLYLLKAFCQNQGRKVLVSKDHFNLIRNELVGFWTEVIARRTLVLDYLFDLPQDRAILIPRRAIRPRSSTQGLDCDAMLATLDLRRGRLLLHLVCEIKSSGGSIRHSEQQLAQLLHTLPQRGIRIYHFGKTAELSVAFGSPLSKLTSYGIIMPASPPGKNQMKFSRKHGFPIIPLPVDGKTVRKTIEELLMDFLSLRDDWQALASLT